MQDLKLFLEPPTLISDWRHDPDNILKCNPEGAAFCELMEEMYLKSTATTNGAARQFVVDLLAETLGPYASAEQIYMDFVSAIRTAKGFREELLREFAPEKIRFVFTSDGVARPTNDPLELVKIMMRPPGNKQFSAMRSFEATLFWCLGMRYLIMQRQNKKPDTFLSELTVKLETDFFSDKIELAREESLKIHYDPKNDFRFADYADGEKKRLPVFEWPMSYRYLDAGGHIIKLLYDSRDKRLQDIFRKILLDSLAANPVAPDSNGITLVFFSEKDLEIGCKLLSKKIFRNLVAHTKSRRNGHSRAVKKNRFSSANSKPEWHFETYYHGQVVEVQVFLFPNFFNRKFCFGDENHHLYRLRQIITLLELLAPQAIYRINWQDSGLQKAMQDLQMARNTVNF